MVRRALFASVGSAAAIALLARCGGATIADLDGGGDGGDTPDACACVDVQPQCKNGDTKKIDCNTCTCSGGMWACTAMACIDAGPPPDGGLPPLDPGSVQCNGTTCASINHFCCDQNGAQTCMSKPIPGTCAGAVRECDDKLDCIGMNVCCIPPNANVKLAYNTRCQSDCGNNDPFSYQVCKTNAECLNGKPCIGQPCLGTVIFTCGGLIPPNRCQ